MTDPEFADRTYIEPLTPEVLEAIIERERPDAVLPTLGGQTALNLAMALHERGVLRTLRRGDDRGQRRGHRHRRGPRAVQGGHDRDRPGRARVRVRLHPRRGHRGRRPHRLPAHRAALATSSAAPAPASPTTTTTWPASPPPAWPPAPSRRSSSSARSPAGRSTSWRSCGTGRTTAWSSAASRTSTPWACTPATPSPWPRPRRFPTYEYQRMRDAAFACIRRIGVETGGSNIQFAVDPVRRRSRSSSR